MQQLRFRKSASQWEEAVPVGNGRLGAMVFGRKEKELICMNEDSLWSGGPMERENLDGREKLEKIREKLRTKDALEAQELSERSFYSRTPHARHYEPLGQVWIQRHRGTDSQNTEYERGLDLEKAVGYIKCGKDEERAFFASAPDQVFVYRMECRGEQRLNLDVFATRRDIGPGKSVSYLDEISASANRIFLQGNNGTLAYAMGVMVSTEGGKISCAGSRITVESAKTVTVYVTGRTTYRSTDPRTWCEDILNRADSTEYGVLRERHIKDYRNYYCRMKLSLENSGNDTMFTPERLRAFRESGRDNGLLETYFNFGRYLLISSSRENSLPANLQGIWSKDFCPSWGSRYTININLQMNYWMAEKTGLSELHLPLAELLKTMQSSGERTARTLYGARGMCAHHNTDIWGDCAPADYYTPATLWPMGAAWLALHVYEHYQYTKEEHFLEEFFPLLEENVLFFTDYMYLNEKNQYVTGPSVSPENTYVTAQGEEVSVCAGPTMDIQIVWELLKIYLKLCREKELGDPEIVRRAEQIYKNLPEIKIGQNGQIMEWQEDYEEKEPGHRHISQLFGLYPGTSIKYSKMPQLAKAAERTLERRMEYGGGHTGWSCAWIIHLYARLRNSEKAYESLVKLLKESTLDNLLDNHPPFQIDGNFGGANAMLEMLVQDYEDEVYLLPALPDAWNCGCLENLRLKCGALLTMGWTDGKLSRVSVKGERTGKVWLVCGNWEKEIHLETGKWQEIIIPSA